MCVNAKNPGKWYCFFFGGKPTAGETVNARGRCRACEVAEPPYEEEPSFLRNEED